MCSLFYFFLHKLSPSEAETVTNWWQKGKSLKGRKVSTEKAADTLVAFCPCLWLIKDPCLAPSLTDRQDERP